MENCVDEPGLVEKTSGIDGFVNVLHCKAPPGVAAGAAGSATRCFGMPI